MSRPILVLDEILIMLQNLKVPTPYLEKFTQDAEALMKHKNRREYDEITVGSGFGQKSQKGHVELSLNGELTQMDAKKAREVGIMLLEAAEAAQSDEIVLKLLEQAGVSPEARGRVLLDLREIRQGTRGTSWPS